jgi:hypothetical protein
VPPLKPIRERADVPINPAPIRSAIADAPDAMTSQSWTVWFQLLWESLKGWKLSSYVETNTATVLNVGAQSSLTVNFTVPGARVSGPTKDLLVAYPYADYGDGVTWTAAITASDTVTFRVHNYSTTTKNVSVGTVRFLLYQQ